MSAPPASVSLDLLTRAILDREPFIAVIGDQAHDLAAVLDAASRAMAERAVRFVRVGGGPSTPLAVGEVIRALGGDEPADDGEEVAERVLQALTRRLDGEDQVVLAVERAETLQPQVLSFLQLLPAIRKNGSPLLQVLFAGRPDFWTLLDQEAFRALRNQLATCVTVARTEQRALVPVRMVPVSEAPPRDRAVRRRRLATGLACAAAVVGLGFVVYGFFYRGLPYELAAISRPPVQAAPQPIPSASPTPAPAAPPAAAKPAASPSDAPPPDSRPAPVPATQTADAAASTAAPAPSEPAPAPAVAASPAGGDRERLRHEFDAFLDQSGAAAGLTEAQRGLLFEQYVARRGAAAPATDPSAAPRAPPATIRRVVIHYPARSGAAEAEAARLRSVLRPDAERTELRAVSAAAREPVIRYFFADDEAAAMQVAADLRGTGGGWRVEDFTAHRPRPSRGTVEVWLPQPE